MEKRHQAPRDSFLFSLLGKSISLVFASNSTLRRPKGQARVGGCRECRPLTKGKQEIQSRHSRERAWARLLKGVVSPSIPDLLPYLQRRLQPHLILEPSNLVLALLASRSENLTQVATSLWLHFPACKMKVYIHFPIFPVFGPISGLGVLVD